MIETKTTLKEAGRLAWIAVRELPQLTPFGVGVHYSYYRHDKEQVDLEIRKQQAELKTERSLRMIAFCVDWIKAHRADISPCNSSYFYAHRVEQYRRDAGDLDPYTHNGCFIAAAVGLDFNWKIDGPNARFNRRTLRQRINNELCSFGQSLRGNNIVQTHNEDCMMMPCRPRVIEWDVDIHVLARKLGVL